MEAHLMADGSAASRALGVKEGEAVDDAVVAKKIAMTVYGAQFGRCTDPRQT